MDIISYQESYWSPYKPTVTKTYSLDNDEMYQTIVDDINENRKVFMYRNNDDKLVHNIDNIICPVCNLKEFTYIIHSVTNLYGKRYTQYDVLCQHCNKKVNSIFRMVLC